MVRGGRPARLLDMTRKVCTGRQGRRTVRNRLFSQCLRGGGRYSPFEGQEVCPETDKYLQKMSLEA